MKQRPAKIKRPTLLRCRGLSLIEVVVASALLVAGLVPILQALTISQGTNRRVETMSHSLVQAQGTLDRIHAQAESNYSQSLAFNSQDLGDGYLATATDDGHARLRTVAVSVGFDQNGNGDLADEEIQVTLTTAVARRD